MDTSESTFGSNGCSINVVEEAEDSRCNWDVELLQFYSLNLDYDIFIDKSSTYNIWHIYYIYF